MHTTHIMYVYIHSHQRTHNTHTKPYMFMSILANVPFVHTYACRHNDDVKQADEVTIRHYRPQQTYLVCAKHISTRLDKQNYSPERSLARLMYKRCTLSLLSNTRVLGRTSEAET